MRAPRSWLMPTRDRTVARALLWGIVLGLVAVVVATRIYR